MCQCTLKLDAGVCVAGARAPPYYTQVGVIVIITWRTRRGVGRETHVIKNKNNENAWQIARRDKNTATAKDAEQQLLLSRVGALLNAGTRRFMDHSSFSAER